MTEAAGRDSDHRARLLQGMAKAVGAKGYSATTIADIVAEAGVSRRTFYEHFQTKADCLIALYEAASLEGLNVLAGAMDRRLDWSKQVERALQAYLSWMAQDPLLMRTLVVEILGLGPDGLLARRQIFEKLARFIASTVNDSRRNRTRVSPELSMAVVGGIHELLLQQIESGNMTELPALAPKMADLVRRTLRD